MDGLVRVAPTTAQNGVLEAFVDWREYDVVVDELPPLHDHERVADVRRRDVVVHVGGNQARRRQWDASQGPGAGLGQA